MWGEACHAGEVSSTSEATAASMPSPLWLCEATCAARGGERRFIFAPCGAEKSFGAFLAGFRRIFSVYGTNPGRRGLLTESP